MTDRKATKQAIFDSGRTVAGWARSHKHSPGTVWQFFSAATPEHYPMSQKIIANLKKDKLWRGHAEALQ